MGQSFTLAPPKLSQHALDALCHELLDAAEIMADEQILCVADALHETLRHRKQLGCRIHQRVEERLCAGGGDPLAVPRGCDATPKSESTDSTESR